MDNRSKMWYNGDMLRAIKGRIYPTQEQRKVIDQTFGCSRFVYNKILERQITNHEQGNKFAGKYEMCKWLTELKEENPWLKKVDSRPLQKSVFALESAYKAFFREGKGFPKFKSRKNKQSYTTNSALKATPYMIKVPKMSPIKCKGNFPAGIVPKQITISKTAGRYYASVLYDDGQPEPSSIIPKTFVGVDLGIKDYAILSNGTKFPNPKYLKKSENHLKYLQRRLSKKTKGSNRRSKAKLKVARQYEKIKNQRLDNIHKTTTAIAKQFDYVAIEDLSVKNMVKNHKLAKAISDCGWYEFRRQLEYKCRWRGKILKIIGRFEPSSKTCSACGFVNHNLTLKDRGWVCPDCHISHDRDVNAAINILKFSMAAGLAVSARGGVNNG